MGTPLAKHKLPVQTDESTHWRYTGEHGGICGWGWLCSHLVNFCEAVSLSGTGQNTRRLTLED
jgi:hypothetical protein